MIDLTATVTGLAPLRAFLAALPGRLADATEGGAGEAADALRDALEERTPRSKGQRAGTTARQWRVRRTRGRAVVENPSPIALFLDVGTKPHVIEGKPVLLWTEGGKKRGARRVKHPGTKAVNYVAAAVRATAAGRQRIFTVRVRRALR